MKLSSIVILEARKRPAINSKISIADEVRNGLEGAEVRYGIKNSYISFTRFKKLGIYPMSEFNTPNGIYCYSCEYVLKQISQRGEETTMADLPFAGNQPYANIFSIKGNMLRIDIMTEDEYNLYIPKVRKVIETYNTSKNNILEAFDDAILNAASQATKPRLVGGRFWYITMIAAERLSLVRGTRSSIIWANLFRQIGIDGIIDNGSGIIFKNEPSQMVVFSMDNIYNISLHYNKYTKYSINAGIKKGESKTTHIRNIEGYSDEELLACVKEYPSLVKYITDEGKRNMVITRYPKCVLELRTPTTEDILSACVGSNMFIIEYVFDFVTINTVSDTKGILTKGIKKEEKRPLLASYFKHALTENTLVELLENYISLNVISIVTLEMLLKVFPHYLKFLELLVELPVHRLVKLVPAMTNKQRNLTIQHFKDTDPSSIQSQYVFKNLDNVNNQIGDNYEAK